VQKNELDNQIDLALSGMEDEFSLRLGESEIPGMCRAVKLSRMESGGAMADNNAAHIIQTFGYCPAEGFSSEEATVTPSAFVTW
jgi:hypothetical protein